MSAARPYSGRGQALHSSMCLPMPSRRPWVIVDGIVTVWRPSNAVGGAPNPLEVFGDEREDYDLHAEQTDDFPRKSRFELGDPPLELRQAPVEIVARDQTGGRIVDFFTERFGHSAVVARGLGPFARQASGIHPLQLLSTTPTLVAKLLNRNVPGFARRPWPG